jgi:peptide/nickel transport system ATP-binding protein
MHKLLEIHNLVTEFQTEDHLVRAVDGISFSIHKGETVGIVGESGSGKSVTALSAMRLVSYPGKIISGEILFHDGEKAVNLLKLSEKEMRSYRGNKIAMIFQEPMTSLNPVFTCGYQVAEAFITHQKISGQEAKDKTIALFEKVKLQRPEQLFSSYPHQLSGGQKQRVMIAMAISCNPSLLIADEPTTALDVTVQKTILGLMQQLQQETEMGLIFITHDLGVVAELADKVLVMYKGKIVEQGTTLEIFSNPKHPYTKGLLACRPPLNKRLKKLPVIADFMKEESDGSFAEINKSVDDIILSAEVTGKETEKRQQQLYAQQPLLQVKNIKTYFPVRKGVFGKITDYVKAVDDISFDVYPGETLGLVGESGCGKTTLGRTIVRLVELNSGKIIFKDKDLSTLEGKEMRMMRKHIQIIFQDPYSSLNPRMTIGESIFEPMKVHSLYDNDRQRKEKVMELLERVQLKPHHYKQYPHEFSGGQRQRISIARALSVQPQFIICDECVSALDVSIQAQVLNLLNQLKEEFGFTYIFISHDLSVVKFMSDRMIVMNNGKIEESGTADEVYHAPKSVYTKRLIDAIPKGTIEAVRKTLAQKNSVTR